MNVAEAKKRGAERHLTKNYNFAGPGTFYKARMKGSDFYENLMKESGRKVVGTKPYDQPYDKIDACGKVHDKVFADPNATGKQVRQADIDFQKCALAAGTGKDQTPEQRVRAMLSIGGFELKKRLEDVGVLRKGSWAAGGEKHVVQQIGDKLKGAASLGKKYLNSRKRGTKVIM
tara:strand:+ start:1562 stop:2083 length:522 start_codon:yes stop_codon:yes gene_type:complete